MGFHSDVSAVNDQDGAWKGHDQRIADVLVAWLRQRKRGAGYWVAYAAWMLVVLIAVAEFPAFGLLLLSIFFMRSVFQLFQMLGIGVDVITTLRPALEKHADGLNDPRLAFAVFDAARIDRVAGKRRIRALRAAAEELVGPDGPASNWNCSAGHGEICAHRTDSAAVEFWKAVAASR